MPSLGFASGCRSTVATQRAAERSRLELAARSRRPAPLIGLGLVALVAASGCSVNLVKDPAEFFNVALIGLTIGVVYALVALGYTLVYGILELINFAHGDVFMLGGLVATRVIVSWFGLDDGSSAGRDRARRSLLTLVVIAVAVRAC